MGKYFSKAVEWVFFATMMPISSVIAVMDWNNGRTFWQNIREISGKEFELKKQQEQKDLIDKSTKS